jgi:CheY-like chemotaxis protein
VTIKDSKLTPLSVLVVEDHEDGAISLEMLLHLFGCRVTIARTGNAALEAAAADPPDVVLLDLLLPDLDGWEVARRLREQFAVEDKRPLLVAVTGCGEERDYSRSADVGIDLHLLKPVESGVLIGVLRRFADALAPGVSR